MTWEQLLEWHLLGRPLSAWGLAVGTFLLIAVLVPIGRRGIKRRFPPEAGAGTWRGLIGTLNARWLRITTLVIGACIAAHILRPDPPGPHIVSAVLVVALAIQALRLAAALVDWLIRRLARSRSPANGEAEAEQAAHSTIAGLRWLALGVCYALIVLLALQNLGVDVTAMIAGLGIGGIAVALAMQNILGDLFASLTIALDKPFVVGDFIIVGSEMGTVEHIGLKTTRVRSLSGEQLVFGNADLLSSRIRNYKRMRERRVVLGFGVVYETTPDQIEQIPPLVRRCIESLDNVRFDRCHFHRFGDSSLDFEAVYYINTPDYNAHMDVQQAILLAIARALHELGIDFAFPTQTLHLVRSRSTPDTHEPART